MSTERNKSFSLHRWNACIEVLCRPLEDLDTVQRPAALAFHYDGRVQNGGHTLHFDSQGDSSGEELLRALREIGATEQARILGEAVSLRRGARQAAEDEQDYAAELIEDLDRRFYSLEPDIPEFLARYFDAHPEHFPK